jgi:outer membrane cobalamin receptor
MGKSGSIFPAALSTWTSRGRMIFFGVALAALSLLICPRDSYSQSDIKIIGRVLDFETGAPLSGAVVAVAGTGIALSSDNSGRFFIENLPQGDYILSAKRLDYEAAESIPVHVDPETPAGITIRLRSRPMSMPDLVVVATKRSRPVIEYVGNITRIKLTPGELESIDDLPNLAPELELVGNGHQRSMRIRGSQTSGVLVLLDGRPQNSLLTSLGDVSRIPLEAVSSIEITKGGGNGSAGLAGSVNFITRPPNDGAEISSSLERGSFGHESYRAGISTGDKGGIASGLEAMSSFSRGDFQYTDPRDSTQIRINNYSHDQQFFGQLRTERSRANMSLNARYFQRAAGVPGPVLQPTPSSVLRDYERELYLISRVALGRDFALDITAGVLSRTIGYLSPATPTSFIPYDNDYSERTRDAGFRLARGGTLKIDGGCALRYESLDGRDHLRPASSLGHHSRHISSANLGFQYPVDGILGPFGDLIISGGLKGEYADDDHFLGPSGTVRANLRLPGRPGIDFTAYRSQRLPGLTDLFWKEDVFTSPNPELESERAVGFEIGADCDLDNRLRVRFSRFETDYRDLIIWRKWGGDKFKPLNLSAARIDGWEYAVDLSARILPISVFSNGSLISPKNMEAGSVTNGKYLTFRPIGAHRAGLRIDIDRFSLSLNGRRIGRRYMTEENTKSLDPVYVFDLSCSQAFDISHIDFEFTFEVKNVGNRQYEILERIPEKPREIVARIIIKGQGGVL